MKITSGVKGLDRLLNGLYIGDNVVWHDDSGSLAFVFCLNFIQISQTEDKPLIYMSFDRSPKNLLDKLGALADHPMLTILDCFTHGKGRSSPVFLRFYDEDSPDPPCRIIAIETPLESESVMNTLYDIHASMKGDVRFVFESITGMQELWGNETNILTFYAHTCPRLYELNTIAYWIMEKHAHSARLRAQINRIAQVAIDLSVKRGTTSLAVLKAENRHLDAQNKPCAYRSKGLDITFESEKRASGLVDLGARLKSLRTQRGLSQKELAKLVGVTSSSISQVESNQSCPSVPALVKMAEVLSVEIGYFFRDTADHRHRVVFSGTEAVRVKCPNLSEDLVQTKLLIPPDIESRAEPYLIEIPPGKAVPLHFFIHKKEEMGYLLSGTLEVKFGKSAHALRAGDTICLRDEIPTKWENPGEDVAQLLWINVR